MAISLVKATTDNGPTVLATARILDLVVIGQSAAPGTLLLIRGDVRAIGSTVEGIGARDRDDLWQELRRLYVVEISIPPLRQRREEIPAFASFFLERFNRRYRREAELCPEAMARFRAHSWPG